MILPERSVKHGSESMIASGIEGLDRELSGGYPSGSIVLLVGGPVSGTELIAQQFCRGDPDFVYLMLDGEVLDGMESGSGMDMDGCLAVCTGTRNVVDSVTSLAERFGRKETLRFLQTLRQRLRVSGGVMVGTFYPGVLPPLTEALLLRTADIVIECSAVPHVNVISRMCVVRKKSGAVPDHYLQYVVQEQGIEMVPTERVA